MKVKDSEEQKRVTLRIPKSLYDVLVKRMVSKGNGLYGGFNRECIEALEKHAYEK